MDNEIYTKAILEARELMYQQTIKNKAPSWFLTELAQEVGCQLAEKYKVDKNIVLLTLYLQHVIFDQVIAGEVQKNHPYLSAKYVVDNRLLDKWNIPNEDQLIIIEAIKSHHKKEKNKELIIEVIKNAECQKFITIKGALIWLHELGLRGYEFNKAKELVFYKMNQKKELLTLDECIKDGNLNCNRIIKMFEDENVLKSLIKLHSLGLKKIEFEQALLESNINITTD